MLVHAHDAAHLVSVQNEAISVVLTRDNLHILRGVLRRWDLGLGHGDAVLVGMQARGDEGLSGASENIGVHQNQFEIQI